MTTNAFHSRIAGLLAEGRSFCCATVVSSRFPGLPAGAKALIFSDGGTEAAGWPEEPLLALRAPAMETLRRRLARSVEVLSGVRVFFDALGPAAELIVCGERRAKSAALRRLLRGGGPELLEISLADDFGNKGGDVCGGTITVFVEPAGVAKRRPEIKVPAGPRPQPQSRHPRG
ncbi:MAG: hypothetical protein M0025_08855 [Elusimicrobia bacterium]|nr:hypothetical protein [Elusimicrobiota bacterium]